LEVEAENNRIVKVKPDKSNVKSEGYFCRKGIEHRLIISITPTDSNIL